jgi:rhodanese-related sulfurtransferase
MQRRMRLVARSSTQKSDFARWKAVSPIDCRSETEFSKRSINKASPFVSRGSAMNPVRSLSIASPHPPNALPTDGLP